jgi:tetratricopeptide (TPR) repeat protein
MNENTQRSVSFFEQGGWYAVWGALFLVPLLVIPSQIFPFQFSKLFVVLLATFVLFIIYARNALIHKQVTIPLSILFISLWTVPLAYIISALFSTTPSLSFFGYRLESDTFGFIFLMTLFVTLATALLPRSRVFSLITAFMYSACIVLVFQVIQVLFGAPFPFAILGDATANLVGRWNDFGVFAGLVGSLALVTYLAIPMKQMGRWIITATFFVALFFLILINLTEAWVLFGLVSFAVLVLVFTQTRNHFGKIALSGVGVLASLVFIFFGTTISTGFQNFFEINSFEVRPSVVGTLEVLQKSYGENPLVGPGPNTFASVWLIHRPDAVLNSLFWNTSFNFASGFFPTSFITGGLLVALAWIFFTIMVLVTIVRALFMESVEGKTYAFTIISGIAVLYLLVMHYIYAPSQSLTILFFMSIALFALSIKDSPLLNARTWTLSGIRTRYALIFVTVIAVVVAGASVYAGSVTYASSVLHERAIQVANAGDLARGETLIQNALALREQDRYHRTAALISLAQLNELIQANEDSDEARTAFQNTLVRAIEHTTRAVQIDSNRFENWLTRAAIYTSVVPFQIQGAFENAEATLEQARLYNPKSPEIDYRLALIHVSEGNVATAREYLEAALTKKANYTQAILLLAQIELNEGNLTEAIDSVRAAVFFEPTNAVLLYQLGILLLQAEEYEQAAAAFEFALQNQPNYSDAAFFLAQAYAFLDRISEAAQLMVQVSQLNPESEFAREFAVALENGENPFGDQTEVTPPPEEQEVE